MRPQAEGRPASSCASLTWLRPERCDLLLQASIMAQTGGYAPDLPGDFKTQAQEHWLRSQSPFFVTPLVQELCQTLDALQLPHQQGVALPDILLRMDIALPEHNVSTAALSFSMCWCKSVSSNCPSCSVNKAMISCCSAFYSLACECKPHFV